MITPILGGPRIGTVNHAPVNRAFRSIDWQSGFTGGRFLDGQATRDATNGTTPQFIRAGLFIGKITSSPPLVGAVGKYANSIIDVTAGALAGAGTTFTLSVAGATELVRRQGTSGTLSLTGGPTANATARTLTVTYSGVVTSTGIVTITPAGVNAVVTITPTTAASAGTWSIRLKRPDGSINETGPIAYNASVATIQTALDVASGVANGIVASGTDGTMSGPHALTLTYSGTGFAALPAPDTPVVDPSGLTGQTNINVVMTTAGVDGRFVAGSLVGGTDGSQVPLSVIPDGWNIDLQDPITASTYYDFPMPQLPIGGEVDTAAIPFWPTDTGIQAYLQSSLKTNGIFIFDTAY